MNIKKINLNSGNAEEQVFNLKIIPLLNSKSKVKLFFNQRIIHYLLGKNQETIKIICPNSENQYGNNDKKCQICFIRGTPIPVISSRHRTFISVFDLDKREEVEIIDINSRLINNFLKEEVPFFMDHDIDITDLKYPFYIKVIRNGTGLHMRYNIEGDICKSALLSKYDLLKIKDTYISPYQAIKQEEKTGEEIQEILSQFLRGE